MAARLGWADAVGGAPSYTGRALRQLGSVLLGGATSARPLGASSGVRPGTPSTIVTASSTTWTVTPFAGVIDGATAAIAGPYPYAFDTNQTGSVTAAGGSARVDRLDVQVVDPAEGGVGGANPLIQIVYTVGTPGLATAPAQSHPLAQINVPASGGGAPTVSWVAPYAVAAGGVVPFPTKPVMDAVTTLPAGTFGTVLNNLSSWVFSGTVWLSIMPALTSGTFAPDGNQTVVSTLNRDVNKYVDLIAQSTRTGGTTYAASLILGVLPAGFRPTIQIPVEVFTFGSGSLNKATINPSTGVITLNTASPAGHTIAQFQIRFLAA